MNCPLCSNPLPQKLYYEDRFRKFYQCSVCQLVVADPGSWPDSGREKAEYDKHENQLDDPGYRRFLERIIPPVKDRIPAGVAALDFGCGPGPLLAKLLNDAGYPCELYDLFYYDNPVALTQNYGLITSTEVVEHLHQPGDVLGQLWGLLVPGGWLAIMTQRVLGLDAFARWQYKNDPTHVVFFAEASFHWLASHLCAKACQFEGRDMVFLQKP